MPNGNGRISWDLIFKISQGLIYPLVAAMLYLLIQMNTLDRRLAVIEVTTSKPEVDVSLLQKIAVIEDRQNSVMKQLSENGSRLDRVVEMLGGRDGRKYDPRYNR